MKIKRRKTALTAVIILAAIIGLLAFLFWYFFVSMYHLPEGTEIDRVVSPDGTYTLVLYAVAPPAEAVARRGELINNETGKKKNIYWDFATTSTYQYWNDHLTGIRWLDEVTVEINGIQLDVRHEHYNRRIGPRWEPEE